MLGKKSVGESRVDLFQSNGAWYNNNNDNVTTTTTTTTTTTIICYGGYSKNAL